jgi:hypothetical protein
MASPAITRRSRRSIMFRVVAGLSAALLLARGGAGLLAPWHDRSGLHALEYHAQIHRWHDAQSGALTGILFAGSLLALIWRPRAHPLLLQFLAVAAALLSAVGGPFDPFVLVLLAAPVALCVAAYPAPRGLRDVSRAEPWSVPLLVLSLAGAAVLVPQAWHAFQLQLAAADAHARLGHWAGEVMLAVALVLAGVLAATKRPGWLALGLLTSVALIYLGLAAVMLPDQPGSWGASGGALATIGGWAFVGATLWEERRSRWRRAAENKPRGG